MSLIVLDSDTGAGPPAADLVSAVTARGSLQSDLTNTIRFAAFAQTAVVIAAVLSTSIAFNSSINGDASVQATLSTQIPLATTVAARATVSSGLSTSIPLTAAIAARTQTASNLATAIPLASVTSARATVAATFEAVAADFVSAIQARATVAGDLSTSISLASLISARCAGASNLSTAIPLSSSSFAVSTVVADMAVVQSPYVVATHNTVQVAIRATQIQVDNRSTRVRFSNV